MLQDQATLSFDITMWWPLVALFGLMALTYVFKLCWLQRVATSGSKAIYLEEFNCIWYMPVLLNIWLVFTPEIKLYQICPQALLCLGLWLFTCGCAIMQKKVASRKKWRDYMHEQGRKFLAVFTYVRRFLLWIEAFKHKLPIQLRAGIGLGAIAVFALMLGNYYRDPKTLAIILCFALILFYIHKASSSLHSCRKLLLFWLAYSTLFASSAAAMLPRLQCGFFDAMAYISFVFLYTLMWLSLAGAADDEPVKMGCEIVNTVTTIALIVINVLAIWGERNLAFLEPFRFNWSILQYYSTIILLPLVVAGYLASMLKSIQIYQKQNGHTTESGKDASHNSP